MTLELQYEIIKPGTDPTEYSWEEVVIGITSPEPLIGFKVHIRAIDTETDPIEHIDWTLVNQEITISLPECGAETYTAEVKEYKSDEYAEAGINEESGYVYPEVFTLTNFYYLPAFSGENTDTFTGEVEASTGFPQEPYNPAEGIYPMDTITRFSPDSRPSVVIEYTITTTWAPTTGGIIDPEDIQEEEIKVYQTVNQPNNNWAAQLQALLQKCYFTHNIYH